MERKRGPGNPGTPDWVRDKIHDIVDNHQHWPRKQVHAQLEKELGEEQKQFLPSERTVGTIMKKYAPPKSELDEPWSVGASIDPRIPVGALGDLLAVWKCCLKEGRRLTVRQAIWVARLRSALTEAEPGFLLRWAELYSRRERSAGGDNPLDTADLDAELAFQPWKSLFHEWEYDTAVLTGTVLPSKSGPILGKGYVPKAADPHRQSRFILNSAQGFLKQVGGPEIDKRQWWEQAESITAFWLDVISAKVPKWQNVDLGHFEAPGARQEWEDMGQRLARWVVGGALEIEKALDLEKTRDERSLEVDEEKLKEINVRIQQAGVEGGKAIDSVIDTYFKPGRGEVGISREEWRDMVSEIVGILRANLTKAKPWRPIQILKDFGCE